MTGATSRIQQLGSACSVAGAEGVWVGVPPGLLLGVELGFEPGDGLGRDVVCWVGAHLLAASLSSATVARAESRLETSMLALTCS